MSKEQMINIICNLAVNDNLLTRDILVSKGITDDGIKLLIQDGFIREDFDNTFKIARVKELYAYAIELKNTGRKQEFKHCVDLCYEINPLDKEICYEEFLCSLLKKDYPTSFACLDVLYATGSYEERKDYNFYLYLLSQITNVPKKYIPTVLKLRFDSIYISEDENSSLITKNLNQVRLLAIGNLFVRALERIECLTSSSISDIKSFWIVKTLLIDAVHIQTRNAQYIYAQVANNNYEGLMSFFEEQVKCRNLSKKEKWAYHILLELQKIKDTGVVPIPTIYDTNNIYAAIKGNNFKLARKLYKETPEKQDSYLLLLLNSICSEIDKTNVKEKLSEIKDGIFYYKDDNEQITYDDLVRALNIRDITYFENALKKYLSLIKQEQYYDVIIDLVRIDIANSENGFKEVNYFLGLLNSFKVPNSEYYVAKYFESVKNGNQIEARLYLNVIVRLSKLNNDFISEEMLSKLPVNESNLISNDKSREITKQTPYDKLEKLVEEKALEMRDSKELAIILDPMSYEDEEKVYQIVGCSNNLWVFTIGNVNPRLVLTFHPLHNYESNAAVLLKQAKTYYECKKYGKCVSILKDVIIAAYSPNLELAETFELLGLSFIGKGLKLSAIRYLNIASGIYENYGHEHNLSELINSINSTITDSFDFISDKSELRVISKLLLGSDVSISLAASKFYLNDEQVCIIKLLMARDYYKAGLFSKGDACLEEAKTLQDKEDYVCSLINELKQNRSNYYERQKNKELQLISN